MSVAAVRPDQLRQASAPLPPRAGVPNAWVWLPKLESSLAPSLSSQLGSRTARLPAAQARALQRMVLLVRSQIPVWFVVGFDMFVRFPSCGVMGRLNGRASFLFANVSVSRVLPSPIAES